MVTGPVYTEFLEKGILPMKYGKLTAALAGATLAITPLAVQAQTRDAAPVENEDSLGGGGAIAGVVAAALVGLVVVAVVTSSDRDINEPPLSA